MRIQITAVGDKMPAWVDQASRDYLQRMPRDCPTELRSVAVAKRGKNPDIARLKQQEAQALLKAVPKSAALIVLDEGGKLWNTQQLAQQLQSWLNDGRDLALLIGGPDGLDDRLKQQAQSQWSLSPLTLPHGLARVLVCEQIYRAWSLLNGHPYHRE